MDMSTMVDASSNVREIVTASRGLARKSGFVDTR